MKKSVKRLPGVPIKEQKWTQVKTDLNTQYWEWCGGERLSGRSNSWGVAQLSEQCGGLPDVSVAQLGCTIHTGTLNLENQVLWT